MKNKIFLAAIFTAIIFTSCEKKDEPKDPNEVTKEMLYGNWDFHSLEIDNQVFFECDPYLLNNYSNSSIISFHNVGAEELEMVRTCNPLGGGGGFYIWYIEDNQLSLHPNKYDIFEIISTPEQIKDGFLYLKYTYSIDNHKPIGGIYAMKKQ